ncbi:MAG: phospholipid carrier-dependent glycosyltransferase [Chloroflexi bacterium]|nr:phospholipid carrier-dependent glycosyltransferase [Chloroflexota bacterium]
MLADENLLTRQPLVTAIERPRVGPVQAIWSRECLVVVLLAAWAAFLFFWRLPDPPKYIYDEVYHAYTGLHMVWNDPQIYEWWESAPTVGVPEGVQNEWTHPPLGKLIIGGGIWLFGNNSFGWRSTNALFGVVCVVLLYLLARTLFRDRLLATIAAGIVSIEGLMFAESRIGTNDIFQLAFLLGAYTCFAKFYWRPARDGIGWLFATGLFLGLAFGTKWPAFFSIMLLGFLAFARALWPARWTRRLRTIRAPVAPPEEADAPSPGVEAEVEALPEAEPAPKWGILGRLGYLIAAFIAMVVQPLVLYVLSYLQMFLQPHQIPANYAEVGPFKLGPISLGPASLPDSSWKSMFIGEQWQMWHYHTTLTAGHPYYSKWWQWLLDIRPVFYYVDRGDDWVANTYNLGNPLLYWGFPIAIVLCCWLVWKKRDFALALVMAALAINWLPWMASPRGMFFYHFLPSVPFLVLMVAYSLVWLLRQPARKWQRVAGIYLAVIFVSFAFFYTQLAAWTVPNWYADIHYWLPSWQ